ncbi:SgcJ/EcaC family oxidoreductase [Gordonia sp. NPDC003950]
MTSSHNSLTRPALHHRQAGIDDAVDALLDHLQRGLDDAEADTYDAMFADDILWGTPKGQALQGFTDLNTIHRTMMPARVAPSSRCVVAQVLAPAPGVVIAQIGRHAVDGGFSEMAMYVLAERDGRWWVAAGQNTPITDTLPGQQG